MEMRYAVKEDIQHISNEELSKALSLLPEWRREKALRFKFTLGQVECAFSYLMLCDLLREEYGINSQPHFLIGEHGKPTLQEHPEIHFNISHCKNAIAVAVSTEPIGIDVECIGRGNESLMNYVLNEGEIQQVKTADNPLVAFTQYWTKKEALFKLLATGITDDIKGLLSQHPNVNIDTQTNTEKGYVLSIAQHSK
jgi:4'-phosphopantetheinyl transferase